MIIGISGKLGSGKDEVAKMIQYLSTKTYKDQYSYQEWIEDYNMDVAHDNWKIKKFADKLKDMVCLLIGCSREQLEDRKFKEEPLGEEWWYYNVRDNINQSYIKKPYLSSDESRLHYDWIEVKLIKLTPRKLMQLLGTEAGREILHPNIWVNALFADYKWHTYKSPTFSVEDLKGPFKYPYWIIPDTRFPNEAEAIKDRDGILIRINRSPSLETNRLPDSLGDLRDKHASETALDEYDDWDYVIENDGTLQDLLIKVKKIYHEIT